MADYMVIMVDIATSLPGSWSHAAIAARSATPTAGLERRSRAARPPPASGGAFSFMRAAMRAALIAAFAAGIAGTSIGMRPLPILSNNFGVRFKFVTTFATSTVIGGIGLERLSN